MVVKPPPIPTHSFNSIGNMWMKFPNAEKRQYFRTVCRDKNTSYLLQTSGVKFQISNMKSCSLVTSSRKIS
jgi:hypothetical protein